MAIGEVADLAVRLSLDDKFSRGLGTATKSLGKFEGSISRIGRGTGQLSSGLARAGTAIAVGVGAAGVGIAKAAIDFEDAFAGIRKTVSEADLAAAGLTFEDIEKDIRDLAKTVPIAATELARLGETAGALGVNAADIDEFVETTALLGVTTNLSADEAADAFGRIGTILNLTGDDYEELADSIVALGNAGASTESEITEIFKRFASEAKSAGLAKEEIAGLASVTASLGFGPERGGTALARVFANMATNISLANKKGKAFAKGVGIPIEDLQDAIDRGEGLPIFLDVLEEIKGMKPTEAAKFLKSIGVTNVSDRTIFRAMADQLPEVNRQLEIANNATGALSEEAQKRFDTVASKIAVFKNNLIDAAITIGEGMIPAIGRATEKLTAFLQQPGNVSELKQLGKDIGDAIDGIDWDEVVKGGKSLVGIMKSAFDWAKRLFDIFNALPTEIKGAAAGLIALNKLSGGLIGGGLGSIVGGVVEPLIRNAFASIPLFGKAFVQPVFVTNMVPGGLGGGPGGPLFGKGGFGKLLVGFTGVGLLALLASEFEDEIQGVAEDLHEAAFGWLPDISPKDLEWPFGPKNTPTILPEVFGGNGLLGGTPNAPPAKPPPSASKPPPGMGGLGAPEMGGKRLLTGLGSLTSSINSLDATLSKPKPTPKSAGGAPGAFRPAPPKPAAGGAPGAFRPVVAAIDKSNVALSGIKTGLATSATNTNVALSGIKTGIATQKAAVTATNVALSGVKTGLNTKIAATNVALSGVKTGIATAKAAAATQSAQQKAELGNIKNATVTGNAQQRAAIVAQTAVNAAGNMLSVFQSASQVLAAAGTTRSVNANAAATRGVAPPIVGTLAAGFASVRAAIWAARPIINTTNVSRSTTVNNRYGPSGGSSTTQRAGGNTG